MLPLALFLLFQPAACRDGARLFQSGDSDGALKIMQSAVQESPTAYCWKVLGVVLAARTEYRDAEPAFAEACRLNPKDPDACYYWARALYSLDRFGDSLKALDRIPSPRASDWRIPMARGQAHDALGQAEPAEAQFKTALASRRRDPALPSEPDPLTSYTAFLYRQGRIDDALARLSEAPAGYARVPAYHYQLGRALSQKEKWEPAAESLRNAVSLQPDYPEAHALLSRVYFRQGKNDLAERHAKLGSQRSTTSR